MSERRDESTNIWWGKKLFILQKKKNVTLSWAGFWLLQKIVSCTNWELQCCSPKSKTVHFFFFSLGCRLLKSLALQPGLCVYNVSVSPFRLQTQIWAPAVRFITASSTTRSSSPSTPPAPSEPRCPWTERWQIGSERVPTSQRVDSVLKELVEQTVWLDFLPSHR